jgi:hypothetical protein
MITIFAHFHQFSKNGVLIKQCYDQFNNLSLPKLPNILPIFSAIKKHNIAPDSYLKEMCIALDYGHATLCTYWTRKRKLY